MLVGRSREIAELGAALDSALAGRGRVLLLTGEGGIGKTRLLEEIAEAASARGALTAWGRCWDGEGAPSYWPIEQILRAPELDSLGLGFGGAGSTAEVTDVEAARARFAIFDEVTSALVRAAADRPLVLLLDDLHWADTPTLLFLKLLSRAVERARILLLGTSREVEAALNEDRRRLLADIARSGRTIPLRGLAVEDVGRLIALADPGAPESLAAWLHRMTGGNPFFVDEMLRLRIAERGAVETSVPAGVREAIQRRLAHLSPAVRAVAGAAAVLGREHDIRLLELVIGEPPGRALEPLIAQGLIAPIAGRAGSYAFCHDLIRESILAELPQQDRGRLHARAADVLLRKKFDEVVDPAILAHHLVCAVSAGGAVDPRAAVRACLDAGERAIAVLAYEDAITSFERALEIAGRHGVDEEHGSALIALGEARILSGDVERGKRLLRGAIELASERGDPILRARAALMFGARVGFGTVDPELISLLSRALADLPEERIDLRARVMARLAAAMQPSDEPEKPIALAKQAIALSRSLADTHARASTLAAARAAFRVVDDLGDRLEIDREALELAIAVGDDRLQILAHRRLAHDLLELGDVLSVERHLERFEALARRSKRPDLLAEIDVLRGMRAATEGRFEEAERALLRAKDAAGRWFQPIAPAGLDPMSIMRLAFARARGRRAELEALLEPGVFPQAVEAGFRAMILVQLGRAREAKVESERAAGRSVGLFARLRSAEEAFAFRDRGLAERARTMLLELADRNIVWWGAPGVSEGAVARLLGQAAAVLESWDEADRWFVQAIAMNERLGAVPFLARTKRDFAAMLVARGRTEDLPRARTLAAEARESFQLLGMELDLEQTASLDGVLSARGMEALASGFPAERPAHGAPPAHPAPLEHGAPRFHREGEIWRVTFGSEEGRFKDSDGMHYLAHLIERPGVEVHAIELEGTAPRAGKRGRVAAADAGPLLDAKAKAAYRARLEALEEEAEEARRFADRGRESRARAEIDAIADELARAVGLGGRDRKAGAAAERARVNVTLRIKRAIERIAEVCPEAAEQLRARIKTGTFCRYDQPGRQGATS